MVRYRRRQLSALSTFVVIGDKEVQKIVALDSSCGQVVLYNRPLLLPDQAAKRTSILTVLCLHYDKNLLISLRMVYDELMWKEKKLAAESLFDTYNGDDNLDTNLTNRLHKQL